MRAPLLGTLAEASLVAHDMMKTGVLASSAAVLLLLAAASLGLASAWRMGPVRDDVLSTVTLGRQLLAAVDQATCDSYESSDGPPFRWAGGQTAVCVPGSTTNGCGTDGCA